MRELNKIREILISKDELLKKLGFKATYVDIVAHDISTFKITLTDNVDKDIDENTTCECKCCKE